MKNSSNLKVNLAFRIPQQYFVFLKKFLWKQDWKTVLKMHVCTKILTDGGWEKKIWMNESSAVTTWPPHMGMCVFVCVAGYEQDEWRVYVTLMYLDAMLNEIVC